MSARIQAYVPCCRLFLVLVTKSYKVDWHFDPGVRSCSCCRQTVDQFVLVSGLLLGPLTRFYLVLLFSFDTYFILFPTAFSLTRKRVCSLQCLHSLVRPLTTNNHTLQSHLRLCSLSVASYDSQGLRWRYSNPPPHGSLKTKFLLSHI
jgi:hypothetical protein